MEEMSVKVKKYQEHNLVQKWEHPVNCWTELLVITFFPRNRDPNEKSLNHITLRNYGGENGKFEKIHTVCLSWAMFLYQYP